MHKFGKNSKQQRSTLHPDLKAIVDEAIKIIDFSILCGHRNEHDQNKAYNERKSKLQYPKSKHNQMPSIAMDIAPWMNGIDWEDDRPFYYLAGIIKAIAYRNNIKIRWGGDWDSDNDFKDNKFNDLLHFELIL